MNENKFAAILNARQTTAAVETPAPVAVETSPPVISVLPVAKPLRKQPRPTISKTAGDTAQAITPVQGRGKRSDPNFQPTTIYLPRELHMNASIALRVANEARTDAEREDFSELVIRLLANWYEKQSYYKPNV